MSATPCTETIALAPDRAMSVRVHRRAGNRLVLHLHGGAFGGCVATGEAVAAALADAGATVHSPDYPAGAAHPFPAALEAAYGALLQLGGRRGRTRLFVAGAEAGGNLAAGLALMCRDRLGPKLAGQILLSPMLDPRLGTCSVRTAEAGAAGCKWAIGWHDYLGTPDIACHPYAAPSSALRLAGLPPALLLTGPNDPMADEAAAYAARLRASGVAVTERRFGCGAAWPEALLGAAPAPAWAGAVREAAAAFFDACTTHD